MNQLLFPTTMNLRFFSVLAAVGALCLLPGARAGAAVPEYLHYQGRALTASGEVLGKGNPVTYQVTIRVWNHPSSILSKPDSRGYVTCRHLNCLAYMVRNIFGLGGGGGGRCDGI